ncbi:hypothetical protein PGSY75_1117300 [Plasmodium gaboni]|uniref:Uncharacterized protein n=1 Tax=Plasmodium gaboni TaxID=647221 RepID=A0A151LIP3_9APIC|nr:hypothetical protein PGSY75_1117300 [Plasmodium gaboni]KYN98812.1 hypothetical protein PGSY75_1117300 [Plasmodium gaboni]SOV15521.1 conserved Plasmodium protein, unknown function [Plasmodium gaboni]SOV23250.1 conserved Plasmodium protein, unknown function [Plasmodium sp. DRC-Itaito]
MLCLIFKVVIFIVGYVLPIGLSLHGWKNKKYEMIEYYLKYVYFFVIFENLVTPSLGRVIYRISSFLWCVLHLTIYIILITPKLNYLNTIYDKISKINNQNNIGLYWNKYLVNPLNDKFNKIIKKLKTL